VRYMFDGTRSHGTCHVISVVRYMFDGTRSHGTCHVISVVRYRRFIPLPIIEHMWVLNEASH
jgi:hypothetical protein